VTTGSPAPSGSRRWQPTAPRTPTFLGARYRRLARRIGKLKALVAIEHSILTATWHVLSANTNYHDLGGDYHAKRDPQQALRRISRDANLLGYTVRFDPSKPHNSPNAASLTAIFDAGAR
jgi:transposase